jgi:hypothetical protein
MQGKELVWWATVRKINKQLELVGRRILSTDEPIVSLLAHNWLLCLAYPFGDDPFMARNYTS